MKLSRFKPLVALIAMVISTQSYALSMRPYLETYGSQLAEQPTGVYDIENKTYFVVRQQCLSEKKFAGTAESKAAEQTFYQLLAQETAKRNVSFNADSIYFAEPLKSDVLNSIKILYQNRSLLQHQLLIDRTHADRHCEREYVVMIDSDQFGQNKVTIPKAAIEKAFNDIIVTALKQEDLNKLNAYIPALGLPSLAPLFLTATQAPNYVINRPLNDTPQVCVNNICSPTTELISPYDINGIVTKVMNDKAPLKFASSLENPELVNILYQQAQLNFSQGKNPDLIVANTLLALNAAADHAPSWKMLADIYRALNQVTYEKKAGIQYFLNQPNNLEAWVYLYLYTELPTEEKSRLKQLIQHLSKTMPISDWAKKQLI